MVDLSRAEWRKSSYSGTNGCVEVALAEDGVAVRDSKDPGGASLVFSVQEWHSFLAGVRGGEFGEPQAGQVL
jgi:hypothetical protein